jgi:hypothetical protein
MISPREWRNRSFEQVITDLVRSEVLRGTVDFSKLIRQLPGVYPSLVLAILQHLAESKQIDEPILNTIMREVARDPLPYREHEHRISFPESHPLDYDWRFAENSVCYLLDRLGHVSSEDQLVALLGAPALMRSALECGFPRKMTLLDADYRVVRSFDGSAADGAVIQCEIGVDALPHIKADVVFADPPWYEEYLDPFLLAASELCVKGGYVIFSVPPLGTRAGIQQERDRLRSHAEARGFEWSEPEQGVVRYVSPLFERNSLRQAGIRNIPLDWRCGDIVTLRLTSHVISKIAPKLPARIAWTEYVIDGVRIRVYPGNTDGVLDPSLQPLVADDILPSVSRSESMRSYVRVWTSGNRVFGCDGRDALRAILYAMRDRDEKDVAGIQRQSPHEAVAELVGRSLKSFEEELVFRCAAQIRELVKYEAEDARLLTCEALPA